MLSNPYPAVLIGGPPHSGKSVLVYHLSQLLRTHRVEHYVLRACPDGEGDWSHKSDPEIVRVLRVKGDFTAAFVKAICDDIGRRQLPLLVDVGGRPTPAQEAIFDACTHAILIAANPSDLDWWREAAERHGLIVLAELVSTLQEPELLRQESPVLLAQIGGLQRQAPLSGTIIYNVANRLHRLFNYSTDDMRRMQLAMAPVVNVVEADRLGSSGGSERDAPSLPPAALSGILSEVAVGVPLAVYGRGPVWLYAALAYHSLPSPFYQFDPRLGWVRPTPVVIGQPWEAETMTWVCRQNTHVAELTVHLTSSHVEYNEMNEVAAPPLSLNTGVIINGKLPYWLTCGLIRAYAPCAWVAVHQATLPNDVLVIGSRIPELQAGELVPRSKLQL